ncbi:MAG TPA: hypothetical protein VM582_04185 [Candidatus Thermoplasmatota archaeon]|nr:hypothetical protein [Candidatus Thermoplasmatota archaeon]
MDRTQDGRSRLETTLRAHAAVQARRARRETAESFLAYLEEVNAPWLTPRVAAIETEPGFAHLLRSRGHLAEVRSLLSDPFVYRLSYNRQLSTTGMWANLDAQHTRLRHVAGAYLNAAAALDAIEDHAEHLLDEDVALSAGLLHESERQGTLLYALLHDIFAMPYGHPLDLVKDVLLSPDGRRGAEKLDKQLLRRALSPFLADPRDTAHPLRALVWRYLSARGLRDDIIERAVQFMASLASWRYVSAAEPEEAARRYFLYELVDSLVDMDRLDHIPLDARFLDGGRAPFSEEDIAGMLSRLRVYQVQDPSTGRVRWRRCFHRGDRALIERILARRADHHRDYFDDPSKAVLDHMLAHAIHHVLEALRCVPLAGGSGDDQAIRSRILDQLSYLTDADLLEVLREFAPDLYTHQLLQDFRSYQPYEQIVRPIVVTDARHRDVAHEADRFRAAFEEERKAELARADSDPRPLTPPEMRAVLSRLDVSHPLSEEARALLFIDAIGPGFLAKHAVEKHLWALLMSEPAFASRFTAYLHLKHGLRPGDPDEDAIIRQLRARPHVWLAMPSFRRGQKERELDARIGYYGDDGGCVSVSLEIARLPDVDRPAAHLLVLAPPLMARDPTLRARVGRAVSEMLHQREWLQPDVLVHLAGA